MHFKARTGLLSALLVVLLAVGGTVVWRQTALADHFQDAALSNGSPTSCGANCHHYDFTITMKKIGSYCRYFILSDDGGDLGVSATYYNNNTGTNTWSYQICASDSPKTVAFDVNTDGGTQVVYVTLTHDADGDGVRDTEDKDFDDLTVNTSGP